jgi:hypothetical protein
MAKHRDIWLYKLLEGYRTALQLRCYYKPYRYTRTLVSSTGRSNRLYLTSHQFPTCARHAAPEGPQLRTHSRVGAAIQ